MNPEEKAKELINKYGRTKAEAVCNELIDTNKWYADNFIAIKKSAQKRVEYWQSVKSEIEKL